NSVGLAERANECYNADDARCTHFSRGKYFMEKMLKRLPILALIALIVVMAISHQGATAQDAATPEASQVATQNLPATQPTVHVQRDGVELTGVRVSSCWPKTDASPFCDLIDDPQPKNNVNVSSGDKLTVTVEPDSPTPNLLSARLLDDLTASGDPQQIDLTQ